MAAFSNVAAGIYRGPSGALFERPWISGVRTWRKLEARTIRAAALELAKRRADQALSTRGLADNPYGSMRGLTVAALLEFYTKKGCPRASHHYREGKQLSDEVYRVSQLREFFGPREASSLTLSDCQEYHKWRVARTKRGAGDRTVDLELSTLSAAFRCAIRHQVETGIRSNPVGQDRQRFVKSEAVRHARDVQPRDAEELHRLARYFFDSQSSEVLGWLLLFQAMTGRRINEIYQLRMDGKDASVPGFVEKGVLHFEERRRHKGASGFIKIHDALQALITAHQIWHLDRYVDTPWYFPGHTLKDRPAGERPNCRKTSVAAIDKNTLTRGLARACPLLEVPHRTSHGLRSYFVNVLRSDGVEDYEIALRIGQKTAGRMIVDVYGERRPDKIGWLPSGPPAWEMFTLNERSNIITVEL